MLRIGLFIFFIFNGISCLLFASNNRDEETIFLRPNTTQVFTELYQKYGLLDNSLINVFDNSLYLDQTGEPPILPLQRSNQVIFNHAERVIRDFHISQKDLELFWAPDEKNAFFYTSIGSIQTIFGLVYAMAMSEPDKKFVFVEKIPYYSGHENSLGKLMPYQNARFQGFHDVEEIKLEPGEVLVEFVTSPNNPDGKFRKPFTDASILIADLVFASPVFGSDGTGYLKENIEWIRKARAEGKHVFSFNSASKQFGKSGNRVGYLWYPMSDSYAKKIFNNFFNYLSTTTVGGNTTGLSDFLNLLSGFLTLPDTGSQLREDAHKTIMIRHDIIKKELLNKYPGSTVTSIAGSPTLFAQIKDSRIPKMSAAKVILEDTHTSINPGTYMGEDTSYIRLNMSGYTEELVIFANRLAGSKKYSRNDMFISSAEVCLERRVCSEKDKKSTYVASPGDCDINVDASNGPMNIVLPPFVGYRQILLTITKTDSSDHSVSIYFGNKTKVLERTGDSFKVKWNQDSFQEIYSASEYPFTG